MAANANEWAAVNDARSYACALIAASIIGILFIAMLYSYLLLTLIARISSMISTTTAGATAPATGFNGNPALFIGIAVFGIIEIILLIYAIIKIRSSFKLLSKNNSNFCTPYSSINYMIIGIVIAIILLLIEVLTKVHVLGFITAIVIIISVLVGILGTALGMWRLGTKYDNTVLKVGSILAIFSFSSLPGIVLVYLGLGEILSKKGKKQ
jgi:hypothetical protein